MPVLVLALLAIGQVVVVARGSVTTVHAAREAARRAALGESPALVRAAAATSGLAPERLQVAITRTATTVTVTVTYRQRTDVAVVGRLVGDVTHREQLTMWREDQSLG